MVEKYYGSAADCKKDYTLPYKAAHKIIALANKPITIKLAMYFFGLELTMFRFNVDYVLRQLLSFLYHFIKHVNVQIHTKIGRFFCKKIWNILFTLID